MDIKNKIVKQAPDGSESMPNQLFVLTPIKETDGLSPGWYTTNQFVGCYWDGSMWRGISPVIFMTNMRITHYYRSVEGVVVTEEELRKFAFQIAKMAKYNGTDREGVERILLQFIQTKLPQKGE